MHVLFLHKNFPAQFGHVARYLIDHHDFRCTFVSERESGTQTGLERIQYAVGGRSSAKSHPCGRSFENMIWHSQAVLDVLQSRQDIEPDLIVGHSGFVSTLFLRELYDCPIVNYFEYFYHTQDSELDFRSDLPDHSLADRVRARSRNANFLIDLDNCDAGYSPTNYQRSRLPAEYHSKVETIFDGIDTDLWKPHLTPSRSYGCWQFPNDRKVVTYVSRGLESMRGFDIFMKIAKRVCERRPDVTFVVVGEDRVAYGGDKRFTDGKTFKQWVLQNGEYDLERILFLGRLPKDQLSQLFTISDLHVYLTVPFVLSWSLLNALSCGATVMASDTAPVREIIEHGINGALFDFFDVDAASELACNLLDDPERSTELGKAGREQILANYSENTCVPKMLNLFNRVTG